MSTAFAKFTADMKPTSYCGFHKNMASEVNVIDIPAPSKGAGYIRTFTGVKFYPLDPHVGDVQIEDIAHALSHACRWAGHTRCPYSVALHSLHVASMVSPQNAFTALMHDAAEAYLGDMAKPVKACMPGFAAAEDKLMDVIATALGFCWPEVPEVKQADAAALYLESKYFFNFDRDVPKVLPPCPNNWHFPVVCSAQPAQVKAWFLAEFNRLRDLQNR